MAAVMDAQRNLLGIIKGVQIDSDTLMQDLIIESDTVKRNINGLLRGAQIIEEYEKMMKNITLKCVCQFMVQLNL